MSYLLASGIADLLGGYFIPGLIVMVALAFVIMILAMSSRYKKFSPNQVGIFYGRQYTGPDGVKRGFRLVAGGGSLLWPIVEHLQVMCTAAFQTTIDEKNIPNRDNVRINVMGVATCKISNTPEDLNSAAMAFLGKSDADITGFVKNILMGHLRSIIGKLGIDEILRKRDTFNKQVVDESSEELKRLGVEVITLVIQDVKDEFGYIEALGRTAVAEAIRDADIKVAQAKAETQMKVSDASREAAVVTADNEVKTAEAQKNRDVQKAQFKVLADTELAKANQALPIATAQQERTLRITEADRDAASAEAEIKVQQQLALRKEQELIVSVVKPADAARQKAVIDADAARQKAVIDADAGKQAAVLNAEAGKEVALRTAEGQKQAAVLTGEGDASKTRATLLALADGEAAKTRLALLAKAEGDAAQKGLVLEAEAKGTKQLAEALAQMTESAKLILILDRLPGLLNTGGDAAAKVAQAIFGPVGAALGSIDEVRIVQMGGGGSGGSGVEQLGNAVPDIVFKFLAGLQARGVDVRALLSKFGVDINKVVGMLGDGTPAVPAAVVPAAPTGAASTIQAAGSDKK